jgi:chromosome segregation ATPase
MSRPAQSPGIDDVSSCTESVDAQKRRLIGELEQIRVDAAESPPLCLEGCAGRLRRAVDENEALLSDLEYLVEAARNVPESTRKALRSSENTRKMLEDTIDSFEGKLLEAIAENGRLHERLDRMQTSLCSVKADAAGVVRQRDELRTQLEDELSSRVTQLHAMAAAEREILHLNDRLLRERGLDGLLSS